MKRYDELGGLVAGEDDVEEWICCYGGRDKQEINPPDEAAKLFPELRSRTRAQIRTESNSTSSCLIRSCYSLF